MKKIIVILCCVFIYLFNSNSLRAEYFPKQVIMIGDSISDSGNVGPFPGVNGTISWIRLSPVTNGTTWIVLLAKDLGSKYLKPSVQGGLNFAYCAAETSEDTGVYSLTAQLGLIPESTNKNFPVFVWGGANNVFFGEEPLPPFEATMAAIDIGNILQSLHDMKYKTLISLNLPDLGYLPVAEPTYHPFSIQFNQEWLRVLKNKKFPIIAIDVSSLFNVAVNNPQKFGYSKPISSAPSLETGDPLRTGETPAGYMFWYDGTHPTEATHIMIKDYVFSIITAPFCYSKLSEEPFGVLRGQNSAIRQQLYPNQTCHCLNKIYTFVNGTFSPKLALPRSEFGGQSDAIGGHALLGFSDRVSRSWTVGAAGGYSIYAFEKSDSKPNNIKFDLQAGSLILFSGFDRPCGYLNFVLDFAWLFFDDIKRKFNIGIVNEQTHSSTHGIDYDAEIYGSYYFFRGCFYKTGPTIDLNYQKDFVNGYKESGADAGNLEFKKQSNSILTSGLGWEVQFFNHFRSTNLTTDLYLIFNRQWFHQNRIITFHEITVPDVWGEIPIQRHRMNFLSGGINFNAQFCRGKVFSAGYSFNVGTFNTEEHFINLSLTIPIGKK